MTASRRDFLAALAAAACAPRTSDVATTDDGLGETGQDTATGDPCAVEPGSAAQGWLALPLSDHPELTEVRGAAYVQARARQVVVAQVEHRCFVALDRVCPHEGALIEYRPVSGKFVCPRHGSLFSSSGAIIAGPAPTGVEAFDAGQVDDDVWVRVTDPS